MRPGRQLVGEGPRIQQNIMCARHCRVRCSKSLVSTVWVQGSHAEGHPLLGRDPKNTELCTRWHQYILPCFWWTHFSSYMCEGKNDLQIGFGNQYPELHFWNRLRTTCNPTICDPWPICIYDRNPKQWLGRSTVQNNGVKICLATHVLEPNVSTCVQGLFQSPLPHVPNASNKACFPRAFRMSLQPRLLRGIRGSVNTQRIQESGMRKHGCCSPMKECCIMRRNRCENWSWTSRTRIAQTNASVSVAVGSHFVIVNSAIAWPQGLGYKTYGRRQHDANHNQSNHICFKKTWAQHLLLSRVCYVLCTLLYT